MVKHKIFLNKTDQILRKRYNSYQTQKCYLNEIELFVSDIDDPYQITLSDIQKHLNLFQNSSRSKQNQVIAALKCLYLDVLGRKNFRYKFIRSKKIEYLPTLLSHHEIKEKLDNIQNIKHKAICSLLYGCGLRRQEIINLRLEDILSKQNQIKIVQSKGNKDRFIPISETGRASVTNSFSISTASVMILYI